MMEQFTKKELERIISLYLDGEMDELERVNFQRYLEEHPDAAKEFSTALKIREVVSRKKPLPPNNWFWLKLSDRLESKRTPRPLWSLMNDPKVALIALSFMIVVVVGGVYLKDAPMLRKFFDEKKELVKNSLMTGNIFPLFANLNKDDVLNFALFGTLPVDSAKNTELQVTNTAGKGAQVEIVKASAAVPSHAVSFVDFCREVGIPSGQREVVDSILGSFRQRLQTSVLVSENNEIAIHAELAEMNKTMVNTIAASLEPLQRSRFQRYLNRHRSPYAVIAMNAPMVTPQVLLRKIPSLSRSNRYVVLSKDTIGIAEMKMNVDSLRTAAFADARRFHRFAAEQMVRDIAALQRESGNGMMVDGLHSGDVRVHSTDDAFQISFGTSPEPMGIPEIGEMVRPRSIPDEAPDAFIHDLRIFGDSAFVMEMSPDSQVMSMLKRLPAGEFRYEYLDSKAAAPRMKLFFRSAPAGQAFENKLRSLRQSREKLIDLDSLLRQSEEESIQSRQPPKQVKMYEL